MIFLACSWEESSSTPLSAPLSVLCSPLSPLCPLMQRLQSNSSDRVAVRASGLGHYEHGTCFVARRLELVAVAGLPWISWCVLGGTGFFCLSFLRTHTACCKYDAASCLINLSTSNDTEPRKRSDRGRFLPFGIKASS